MTSTYIEIAYMQGVELLAPFDEQRAAVVAVQTTSQQLGRVVAEAAVLRAQARAPSCTIDMQAYSVTHYASPH
jgi:hypothetical protein